MFKQKRGNRSQVWNGLAERTSGGLFKKDLKMKSNGDIVSVRKSDLAKKFYNQRNGIRRTTIVRVGGGRDEGDSAQRSTGTDSTDSIVPGKEPKSLVHVV
jgi:hypothetical protein